MGRGQVVEKEKLVFSSIFRQYRKGEFESRNGGLSGLNNN